MSIDFLAEEINNYACTQYEIYVVFAWIIWERGEVYYFCPIRPDLAIKNMVPPGKCAKGGYHNLCSNQHNFPYKRRHK